MRCSLCQIMMFGNLLIFPKDINPLDANGYSRPKETAKEMLKDTRLGWLLKGIHSEKSLISQTFSPVSTKDSFRLIMALVAHFDLKLHQMDVKTSFLNGDFIEEVYMSQPEGFEANGKDNMVCRLKRSIYGLKQAFR